MARDTTALLHRALEAAEQWRRAPRAARAEERAAAEVAYGSMSARRLSTELHEGGSCPSRGTAPGRRRPSRISGSGA